jgi:hypothetical protein
MSDPAVTSFFKRFAVKFIEVVGAGIATALSGYLLAHFSGYWSAPASAPPAVQVAPNTSAGTGTGTGTSVVSKSQRAQPARATSTDAKEQRVTTANPPAVQPARAVVSTKEVSAKEANAKEANAKESAASRKQSPAEVPAVESKPRDEESVEAQVRAALANVDASHPAPAEVTPRPSDVSPLPPAVAAQPKPAESTPPPAAVAAVPPAAETAPPPAEKGPLEPEPLAPVEIKSRPVAAVEASPPVAPVSAVKEEDRDILSMIKKIPDLLRPKPSASDGEAPRPPLPVGN